MSAYAFRNEDKIERKSSSGGAFTAILEAFIQLSQAANNKNSVNKNEWICFGAAFDKEFNVTHQSASSIDECDKFRGSKYVASDMTEIYPELKKALSENKYVLFTGTPCMVSAVRAYIKTNNLPHDRFYTIDLICHGTPSQKLWQDYVKWLEAKNGSSLEKFSFRYKGTRWKDYSCMAEFANGVRKENTQDVQMFTTLYFTGLTFRECCYKCRFTNLNRTGDITIGDFWGFENTMSRIASKWGGKGK